MEKLFTFKDNFIAYNQYKSNKKNAPYVIFIHGYASDMAGTKALYLENYCKQIDCNFIRFDQYGCGKSSGKFAEQTISSQLSALDEIIIRLCTGPIILIGSSAGAWLALLASIKFSNQINGLICLAPAPDFTKSLVWDKLSDEQKELMKSQGYLNIPQEHCNDTAIVSYNLIEDSKKYLLMDKDEINIGNKVHLIHGMKDEEVPYNYSIKLADKIKSSHLVLKIIKDGEHRLSRAEDLKILEHSLIELLLDY